MRRIIKKCLRRVAKPAEWLCCQPAGKCRNYRNLSRRATGLGRHLVRPRGDRRQTFRRDFADDMVQHQSTVWQMAAQYETVGGNLFALKCSGRRDLSLSRARPGGGGRRFGRGQRAGGKTAPRRALNIGDYRALYSRRDNHGYAIGLQKGGGRGNSTPTPWPSLSAKCRCTASASGTLDCGNRDGNFETNLALAQGGDALKQRLRQLLD